MRQILLFDKNMIVYTYNFRTHRQKDITKNLDPMKEFLLSKIEMTNGGLGRIWISERFSKSRNSFY